MTDVVEEQEEQQVATPEGAAETSSPLEQTTETPAVEPSDDVEVSTDEKVQSAEYVETGNKTLDSVGKIVSDVGLDFGNYARELESQIKGDDTVDVSLSEESFKELVDKFGEGVAQMLEDKLVSEYKTLQENGIKIRDTTYEAFGGKEKFLQIAEVFKDEGLMSKEDMTKLGHLLAKGGVEQQAAIKTIKELHMTSQAYEQSPTLVQDGEQAPPEGTQPISRVEYTKEKLEAMKSGDKAKVEALNKRAKYTMEKQSQYWR